MGVFRGGLIYGFLAFFSGSRGGAGGATPCVW